MLILLFAGCLTAIGPLASAQSKSSLVTLKINVISESDGEPVIGAACQLPDYGIFAVTDLDGLGVMEKVPAGNATLTVQMLGYEDYKQQFQIGNTKIGGNVDVLGGCTALVGVNAYNANLAGTVPEAFGNLSAVTTIRLEDNDITGNIPESFGNLPAKCTDLRLKGNKMSGVVPAAVKSHANWATGNKKWNPATNILPQQEGFGLTE